jgi:uncharacterized protein
MKKQLLILAGMLMCSHLLLAQTTPYNVVFDMTSDDTVSHKMAMRWISEVIDNNPAANAEIVFYGKSLSMITQGKSVVAEAVKTYSEKKNVAFRVCAIAMKNNKLDKSQLLPGVQIVPDGIYEILTKQHDGWGYIKVSH